MLPKELIEEIRYFYQPMEINVEEDDYIVYFQIKYYSMNIRINTSTTISENCSNFNDIYKEYCKPDNLYDKRDDQLDEFITEMSNNEDCYYDESYYYDCELKRAFNIIVDGNNITISDGTITIDLPPASKNLLLLAMKKYQSIIE